MTLNWTPALAAPAPGLVQHEVRLGRHEHVVARSRQAAQRDLVGHRARGQEERGLEAEQRGDLVLQPVDRRILAVLVVADLRLGHGAAHRGARQGHRIRAQVDPVRHGSDDRAADQAVGSRPRSRRGRRRCTRAANGADGLGSVPGAPRSHSTAASRSSTQNGLARTATPGARDEVDRHRGQHDPGADEDARQLEDVGALACIELEELGAVDDHGVGALPQPEACLQLVRREHLRLGKELGEQVQDPGLTIAHPEHSRHGHILEHTERHGTPRLHDLGEAFVRGVPMRVRLLSR